MLGTEVRGEHYGLYRRGVQGHGHSVGEGRAACARFAGYVVAYHPTPRDYAVGCHCGRTIAARWP